MISETWALTVRELRKWVRTPALVLVALVQPILWLALFGSAFNPTNLIPRSVAGLQIPDQVYDQISNSILSQTFGGAPNYITYLASGILCMILLFNSAFSGGSIVWDRRFGFLNKLLAAPIPRTSIFLSKVLSTIFKGMFQAFVIFFFALVIPGGLILSTSFNALDFVGLFVGLFLLALGLSSAFTAIAVRIAKWETLIAIVNFINLPMLFVSSALFPISSMPSWLQAVANVNPMTKAIEISRFFVIQGSLTAAQYGSMFYDFAYLAIFAVSFTILGAFASRIALRRD